MDGRDYGGNVRKYQHESVTWVDAYDPKAAILERLEKEYKLHPLHLHESLQKVQHNQVEREKNYLFLVMHFPVLGRHGEKIGVGQLGMFLGKDFVVTVHAEHAPFIDELYMHCAHDPEKGVCARAPTLPMLLLRTYSALSRI